MRLSNFTDETTVIIVTATNTTLSTDSDKSYKVTANIHSSSSQVFSAEANATASIGPVIFDCYDVVSDATNADFNSQLTIAQSEGGSAPNWLSIDSASANISVSNAPSVRSDNYTVTNTYTGVFSGSFTFDTNVTVSITPSSVTNTTTGNTTDPSTTNNEKDNDNY